MVIVSPKTLKSNEQNEWMLAVLPGSMWQLLHCVALFQPFHAFGIGARPDT